MKFTRLRLTGFKSFVEPADLMIEPGLTGVVGPNGCGKSNLLEALRWVMGESSYKNMRGSGMDDVIFSGTAERPSRNMAEVLVTLDNEDRDAPPQFNGNDILEIARQIAREAGSSYRINGKEVRARDVQLLFADASTGARSPSLVRQGQIAEIINAKPQARRLILEEAAGITGLHSRRHEAELKLRAAEQNLARLEDVLAQLETQLNSLKRQARQAAKYKQVSAEIRKWEAAGLFAAWQDAALATERDTGGFDKSTRTLAESTRAASEALRARDAAGEELPPLRDEETVRAAVLQRLTLERQSLDAEDKRLAERLKELEARVAQATSDLARAHEAVRDAETVTVRLAEEESEIVTAQGEEGGARNEAAGLLQNAAVVLGRVQIEADASATKLADLTARRNAALKAIEEQRARTGRLEAEAQSLSAKRAALIAAAGPLEDGPRLGVAVETAVAAAQAAEARIAEAEAVQRAQRGLEAETRHAHDERRRQADSLRTEMRTLSGLLKSGGGDLWPSLVDQLRVMPGFEIALGAALGDDIDASANEAAPVHWRGLPPLDGAAPLPPGAEPLSIFVDAPAALARRLSHIGVIARELGPDLQPQLQPGQRLVSREGDVWSWDGFTSAAEAPTAAANRLAERNRLDTLEVEAREAQHAADEARDAFEAARQAAEAAGRAERDAREAWRTVSSAVEFARRALQSHERQVAERTTQTSAVDEALRRVEQSLDEARLAGTELDMPQPEEIVELTQTLESQRRTVNTERAAYTELRARHDGLEREARQRFERLKAIAADQAQWRERENRARGQIEALDARLEETRAALAEAKDAPKHLAERRMTLMNITAEAEQQRQEAADHLAEAANRHRDAEALLRERQDALSQEREAHARLEARLEAARDRLAHCERRIAETLSCAPDEIAGRAGFDVAKLPSTDELERKLFGLRDDRERLGGVNLMADDEAAAVASQLEGLVTERDDLVQAIAKLRGGIGSLNREGRQRLLDAFGTVNEKFGELFTTLFGGGRAELQLIESDDPLEAGLEILAHPPGKKPTVLSLLSGGEQTLTALSLIFAVFLTNPSPICVLDEVDAPLDDHNVERFCNLLDAMLERTETRFLIITHHPLTMARMNRLYGVTMMERGVSQLVSVNLEQAEQLRDAS